MSQNSCVTHVRPVCVFSHGGRLSVRSVHSNLVSSLYHRLDYTELILRLFLPNLDC